MYRFYPKTFESEKVVKETVSECDLPNQDAGVAWFFVLGLLAVMLIAGALGL